jgi:hypothetical protein
MNKNPLKSTENNRLRGLGTFTRQQERAGQKKGLEKDIKYENRQAWNKNTGSYVQDSYDQSYPTGQNEEFYLRPSYYQNLPLLDLGGVLPGGLDLGGGNVRMIDEEGDPMYSLDYIPTDDGEIQQEAFLNNLDRGQLQPTKTAAKWSGPYGPDSEKYYLQIGGDPSKDFRNPLYPKEKYEDEDRKNMNISNPGFFKRLKMKKFNL